MVQEVEVLKNVHETRTTEVEKSSTRLGEHAVSGEVNVGVDDSRWNVCVHGLP